MIKFTHVDEYESSMIIKPQPTAKSAKAIHITGRYCPVRLTRTPDNAEKSAAPKEYGIILHEGGNENLEIYEPVRRTKHRP